MSNTNKILIAVVSCVFMICVASVSIVSIVTSNQKETTATTDAPPSQYIEPDTSTTQAPSVSQQVQSTSQTTTASSQQASTATTAPSEASPSTSASAVTGNLAADILGLWKDSAGMSGYEFLEGGKFNWTYVDLAGFGVPFNGKTSGLYTLEGDTLTVKYSIYSATIKKTYRISITGNELSMYDLEEHETSTYLRAS